MVEQSRSNAEFVLKNPAFFSESDSLNSDIKTKAFLREFAWDGSELVIEKNVSIAVKLVNPKSKFQLDYRNLSK